MGSISRYFHDHTVIWAANEVRIISMVPQRVWTHRYADGGDIKEFLLKFTEEATLADPVAFAKEFTLYHSDFSQGRGSSSVADLKRLLFPHQS